jgi:butyryl-CoA dehydrogenase
VGEEGKGLACMFQMMNEARIGVGISAAAIAMRGFLYALDYARQRPQGRLPSNKDPRTPQVKLTAHAAVRRMLLAQKAYAEGALALCLYAASLLEDSRTLADARQRQRAAALLDLLTPVVKSWPSRYGCVANDLAIQVLGGAGYMREYPVEQLYRDQRLNAIHEGAEGIHGLDLLGRKVRMQGGVALEYLRSDIEATIAACAVHAGLHAMATTLQRHLDLVLTTTATLAGLVERDPDAGLSNASVYLDAFGRLCAAWIWLRQALVAQRVLASGATQADRLYYEGKLAAASYYINWELPVLVHQCRLLTEPNLEPFRLDADCL